MSALQENDDDKVARMSGSTTPKQRAQEIALLSTFGPTGDVYNRLWKAIATEIEAVEAPLLARIAKLETHFDNCFAEKIVTLQDKLQRISNLAGDYRIRIEELEEMLRVCEAKHDK